MTIILSIADGKDPVHLLSDVVLSAEGAHETKVLLPHVHVPAKMQFGNHSIVGVSQKTVIFGKTAFMWAGTEVTARAILHSFLDKTNGGNEYAGLNKAIDELDLLPEERERVSLMSFFCERHDNIATCGFNMKTYKVPLGDGTSGDIRAAGSGSWDFIESYQATRQRPVEYSLTTDLIHRLSLRTIEPFFQKTATLNSLYGAWFELSAHLDGQFEKLPVAFKFWPRYPESPTYDETGILVFSQYLESDMVLTTIGQTAQGTKTAMSRVPDLLRRGRTSDAWRSEELLGALHFSPKLFIHVLFDVSPGTIQGTRICPFFVDGDPLLTVEYALGSDGSLNATPVISQELREFINSQDDDSEVAVEAPDWR